MKKYDFRFDKISIQSFVGKNLKGYKHAEFMCTNTVTCVLGFQVEEKVYALTNEYESLDFFTLDNEATVFRVDEFDWKMIEQSINNVVSGNSIDETINKIALINDHTVLRIDNEIEYDMWDTKAIIFYLNNREICFKKQDCWFSQEIEIFKGYDLIEKVGNEQSILEDFADSQTKNINVERVIEIFK